MIALTNYFIHILKSCYLYFFLLKKAFPNILIFFICLNVKRGNQSLCVSSSSKVLPSLFSDCFLCLLTLLVWYFLFDCFNRLLWILLLGKHPKHLYLTQASFFKFRCLYVFIFCPSWWLSSTLRTKWSHVS